MHTEANNNQTNKNHTKHGLPPKKRFSLFTSLVARLKAMGYYVIPLLVPLPRSSSKPVLYSGPSCKHSL
jgi:hypothetical protein